MKTDRSKVKRIPKRGHYENETIYSILDKEFICQIGFVHKDHPVVIPTIYGRNEYVLFSDSLSFTNTGGTLSQASRLSSFNFCSDFMIGKVKGAIISSCAILPTVKLPYSKGLSRGIILTIIITRINPKPNFAISSKASTPKIVFSRK